MLINEIDADSAGSDTAEFIELYDGGRGGVALDGLAVVLFNGGDDKSYRVVDLDGYATDANGYFLLGGAAVPGVDAILPDGLLQNGPDAAALAMGDAADFPNGTPVAGVSPLDAIVYGPAASPDAGLLPLLSAGQAQVDEAGRGDADGHSLQRCPNGAGGPRATAAYRPNTPTPGALSGCTSDAAPELIDRTPGRNETGVSRHAAITTTFNEPVALAAGWATVQCAASGSHTYSVSGGPTAFTLQPTAPFAAGEACTVTVVARHVTDLDADDPPDTMAANVAWSFTTAEPAADFVVINELDADTPSTDTAEFIELYDGGEGNVSLDGLALVLFNGSTNAVYGALDLDSFTTDASGYFVAGNAATGPDLTFANSTLQNGPDAVALYAGDATGFPNGAPITADGLIDALVYGRPADVPAGLLALLLPGEGPVDEGGRGTADQHALQRCPNGAGGQRRTAAFAPNTPTPGRPSACVVDQAPAVSDVTPPDGAKGVALRAALSVTFSEPVALAAGGPEIACASSGDHAYTLSGGPRTFQIAPTQPFAPNEWCEATIPAAAVSDIDADDPPDRPTTNFVWSFTTAGPVADFVLLNELDADTPGNDTAEFIELYDGGAGETDLTGLVLVLYNGGDDRSYYAVDLGGARTDKRGYAVIGNSGVAGSAIDLPNGALQNGADAVALYEGRATDFPSGAPLTTNGLIDAVVYGTADVADAGLLALLLPGQPQVDEAGRGAPESHASGRCPNAAGGARVTSAFRPNPPTPGASNICTADAPPAVVEVTPVDGAEDVPAGALLTMRFSEDVAVAAGWFLIDCEASGQHAATVSGGPRTFTLVPTVPFGAGETCEATIRAAGVRDADADDPPDNPPADYTWSFHVAAPAPEGVFINEIDADTPGSDMAEFIELYDGGRGRTALTGLVVVFWNGQNDTAYRAVDLIGQATDAAGYFTLGNPGLPPDLSFPNAALQNGPDAIALYTGRASDFPVGLALTTTGLVDAVVYGRADQPDGGLLTLLAAGQPQTDEAAHGAAEAHSLQRCPNGTGGLRHTATYDAHVPTLGAANECPTDPDDQPAVVEVTPADGATGVPTGIALTVRFSEDVTLLDSWYTIDCAISDGHAAAVAGGPRAFTLTPTAPFVAGETCAATVRAAGVRDTDADDPPDNPGADYRWQFHIAAGPVADFVLINELDADTPGSDRAEFVELYDGGVGRTDLTGLVAVFWNGKGDVVYRAIDLAGQQTDGRGYFLLGNPGVSPGLTFPNAALQNGPDAVSLHVGRAADFPTGKALATAGVIDAVVYGAAGAPDVGLLALLTAGQPQVDEAAGGAVEAHALQRCPNGSGSQRHTDAFRPGPPTPGAANSCVDDPDEPPAVVEVAPADRATDVPAGATLTARFSEDVVMAAGWYAIDCASSGNHTATVSGGPRSFTLTPTVPFATGESCAATIRAASVRDADTDDPPDTPAADYSWQFTVATGPVADGVLINELDADTPGSDAAEFIELFDGGAGQTELSGLVLVLWNGKGDVVYQALDLAGQQTDTTGYFVVGSGSLNPDLKLPEAALQNGPDAVALYAGRATDFPKGRALTTAGLLDAVVYGATDAPDGELLALLAAGQPQVDEAAGGAAETHALQRCPDGAGGPRHTAAMRPAPPTPGASNACAADEPPAVSAVSPAPEATNVPLDARLVITFTEAVTLDEGWLRLTCDAAGERPLSIIATGSSAVVIPRDPLPPGDACAATVAAARVHDADPADPPDAPPADHTWRFHTAAPPPVLVAAFTSDSPVWIDRPLHLSNASTGPGVLRYTWTFGDGSPPASDAHPTHHYAAPGRYLVTLTVRAGAAVAVAQAIVEVRPRAVYLPAALR